MAEGEDSSARERELRENDSGGTVDRPTLETAEPVHEQSPLLTASETGDEEGAGLIEDESTLDDGNREFESKSTWYLILLTISIGGLQLAWAVELSNGTPYLLSLGLSKSVMALVWIAGPLSGALVQPYVGILSDNCRSKWGKRTPFMATGATATIISLLALAWVREIVGGFLGLFNAERDSEGVKISIIVVAVLFVYILDFSINTVQAGIRAFILDCCPSHQQEAANAMASRVLGVGNIIGYVAGYLDLPKHVGWLGNTQFKVLCVIASVALGSTVMISIGSIRERDASIDGPPIKGRGGILTFFQQVFKSIRRLPPQTRKVCEVEFFAWIGFFPQLFYSSSYIGDIYVQPYLEANPNMTPEETDALYENATRVGTFALLVYAITSLSTNVLLPFLIAPSYDAPSVNSKKDESKLLTRILSYLVIPGLTLRRAWLISHLIFASCMFSTLVVRSISGATALIGIVGVSWALTLWAPFAIISAEVSKLEELRRSRGVPDDGTADQAGVILGIHNMSVAAPQILATIGSSIIFRFLQKPRGVPGDHSMAVVLACGGIFTLVAAYLTSLIKDEIEVPGDVRAEEGEQRNRVMGRRRNSEAGLVSNERIGGLEY